MLQYFPSNLTKAFSRLSRIHDFILKLDNAIANHGQVSKIAQLAVLSGKN